MAPRFEGLPRVKVWKHDGISLYSRLREVLDFRLERQEARPSTNGMADCILTMDMVDP